MKAAEDENVNVKRDERKFYVAKSLLKFPQSFLNEVLSLCNIIHFFALN